MSISSSAAPASAPREMPGWLFGFFMGSAFVCAIVLISFGIAHAHGVVI